jgi:glycosyltransferase involved in cell wall biosynthesis
LKKVLFVFYVPSGGVETLNRQRCAALKTFNIEGHSLYYQKKRDLLNPSEGRTFIGKDPEMIKRVLTEGKYSAIVVISDYQILPLFRKLGYKGKLIIEIQGLGSKERARQFLNQGKSIIEAHADALLNPKTPHIEKLLHELFPSTPKFSFNNCFDTRAFHYTQTKKSAYPIIGWTGRIDDNKNWSEFLRIGHRLIKEVNPNTQLYMFEDPSLCDAEERKRFFQMIRTLDLQKNLSLLHHVPHDKMPNYFSAMGESGGFYCSTSKVEGAPYSVLEALSCKCPVLTTDSDGVRSAVIDNETGIYYTLGNIQEAVKEARELMTNSKKREEIRDSGLKHVQNHFHPNQYSTHFIQMLTSIGAM